MQSGVRKMPLESRVGAEGVTKETEDGKVRDGG